MVHPTNCWQCQHMMIPPGVVPPIATCQAVIGMLGCGHCGKWSENLRWRWSGLGRISCCRCGHAQDIPLRDNWRIGCCATDTSVDVIVPFQGKAECEWHAPLVPADEALKGDQGRLL